MPSRAKCPVSDGPSPYIVGSGGTGMSRESVLSWLAIIVSVAAAAFTGLQWIEARHQTQLANEASIGFDINTEPTQRRLGVSIRNVGPGVLTIRSITYYVDHKIVTDINDAVEKAQLDPDNDHGIDLEAGDPMAVGDKVWVLDYRTKRKEEIKRAADFIENHFSVGVDYCSANGKCRFTCSNDGSCQHPGAHAATMRIDPVETNDPQSSLSTLSWDKLPDWLVAVGTLSAVLVALWQTHRQLLEAASRTYFEHATSALMTAVEDFSANGRPDGSPRNDRRHWLTFARALEPYKD
jgi:hypothetical protein